MEVRQGDTITMQCTHNAPFPKRQCRAAAAGIDVETPIEWFKDDELLTPTTESELMVKAAGPLPGIRRMTMRTVEDAGVYVCQGTFEDTQQIFTKKTRVTRPALPLPGWMKRGMMGPR